MLKFTATTPQELQDIENKISLNIDLISYECYDEPINDCIFLHAEFTHNHTPYSTVLFIHGRDNVTITDLTRAFNNSIEDLELQLEEQNRSYFIGYVSSLVFNRHNTNFKKLGDRSPNPVFSRIKEHIEKLIDSGISFKDVYLKALFESQDIFNNSNLAFS